MRYTLPATLTAAVTILCGPTVSATPAELTVDDATPTVDDDRTVTLVLTNLTDDELHVSTRSKPTDACPLDTQIYLLPAAQPTTVKVAIPDTCDVPDTGLRFTVWTTATEIDIVATTAPAVLSAWTSLWVFPAVLLLFSGFAVAMWRFEMRSHEKDALPYLDAAWSFKDSWAGNVTVIGGLLTGVVGSSDVVKALLGEDADQSIALATVGAAIAVALVAAGPVLFVATKCDKEFRISGLLAAATLTVTGAVGELVVVAESARSLDLGGWQNTVWVPCMAAITLLLVYAYRTVRQTVVDGTTAPSIDDSDIIRAAKLLVAAIRPDTAGPRSITTLVKPPGTRRVSGSI